MPNAKNKVKDITIEGLREHMYGAIQDMIEGNAPNNVSFQYFLPPVPFGPELAGFMEIGPKAKKLRDEGYTVADMMRAAVNFANIVDYVPIVHTPDPKKPGGNITDLSTLISSGIKISDVYRSVLNNCRVVDNSRSEEDEEKLRKLRALLYKDYPEDAGSDTVPEPGQEGENKDEDEDILNIEDDMSIDDEADALLAEFDEDDDDDFDLDAVFSDGASTDDILTNPDQIAEPTKIMKIYQALLLRYEMTVLAVLDDLKKISPNDPNAGLIKTLHKKKIRNAKNILEVQGRATKVRAIIAKIEQLSQGGMPQYVSNLRARMEGLEILASIFSSEEGGSSLMSETAYYTALRPNGILTAPSMMKVTMSSSSSSTWSKFKHKSTSGGVSAPIPWVPGLSVNANAGYTKTSRASEALGENFMISFEIAQAFIDRQFLDLSFLESPAYTTIDPNTNKPLDPIMEITTLSDGKTPPESGLMPQIPMVAYFIRNLRLSSSNFANMSEDERSSLTVGGGISYLGFGAKGQHHESKVETSYSQANNSGTISANGTYLVALSSRYLKKAPNPNFKSYPKDKWI